MIYLYRIVCLCLSAALLSACVTTQQWNPTDYTVKSGDTLYSIAWRYELDPDDLERWNHLGDNSVIYPGERLHMRAPVNNSLPASAESPVAAEKREETGSAQKVPVAPETAAKTNSGVIVVRKGDTLYSLARMHDLDMAQLIRANQLKRPYRLYPGEKLYTHRQLARLAPAPVAPASIAAPHKQTVKASYHTVAHWRWPLKGKIVSYFNRNSETRKGIDIAGYAGEDVRAAAAGKVVYSGNGLVSFGNLVIIKHNDDFLSAYAHNRNILVVEGQWVKQGQVIATIGKTNNSNSVLHFEIRKHGKPVNPLRYLPRG